MKKQYGEQSKKSVKNLSKEVDLQESPKELFERIKSVHDKKPILLKLSEVVLTKEIYQRLLNAKKVQKMINEFDEYLFAPIVVSLREDGIYRIIDGQHRYTFAKYVGMTEIYCTIRETEGVAHEAQIFKKINHASTPLKNYDDFKCDVASGEIMQNAIVDTAKKHNIEIGKSVGVCRISLINDLLTFYQSYGIGCLDSAFRVISEVYPNEVDACKGTFFRSLVEFIHYTEKSVTFKLPEFIRILKQNLVTGDTAKSLAADFVKSKGKGPAKVALAESAIKNFTEIYNYRKLSHNKI